MTIVMVLRDGRVRADGEPGEVLTPSILKDVLDVDAVLVEDPVTGWPLFVAR